MAAFFLKLINMSINASWVLLAVFIARLLLKNAPKYIHCLLWGLVAVRLVCPYSVESAMSLLPSAKTIEPQVLLSQNPTIHSGINKLDQMVNSILTDKLVVEPNAVVHPLEPWIEKAGHIWLAGMLMLLLYSMLAYLILRIKVRVSICYNVFNDIDVIKMCDGIESPFILGILEPVIYLPSNLSKETQNFVVAHERAHLKRHDQLWKPFGFLLLAIYWFNPLMWVAYILLCRDIEMACDEQVAQILNGRERKEYASTLLSRSVPSHLIAAYPLAFGAIGIKQRIKNILNYKKPVLKVWVATFLVGIFITACFLTNPKGVPGVANYAGTRKMVRANYSVQLQYKGEK